MPRFLRSSPYREFFQFCLRLAVAFLCAATFAWPIGSARADTRPPVRAVVVARDLDAPIVRKLRAELAAQGFESLAVWGPPSAPSPGELASIARGADARAVLRVDEPARSIAVWLAAADGASPVLVDTVHWSGPENEGAASVQAAATVHAALVGMDAIRAPLPPPPAAASSTAESPLLPPLVQVVPPPPVAVVPLAPVAPPPVAAPVLVVSPPTPARFDRFTLAIGVSVVASPGGVGPMGDVTLAGAWHPAATWALGLVGQLPVLTSTLSGPGATMVHVGATLLGAEVAHSFGLKSWKVHPDLALGAGAIALHLEGTPTSQADVAPTADAWLGAALLRGGLAVPIAADWRLRGDATLALALPEALVDFGKTRVASWGRPMVTGGISVEFAVH